MTHGGRPRCCASETSSASIAWWPRCTPSKLPIVRAQAGAIPGWWKPRNTCMRRLSDAQSRRPLSEAEGGRQPRGPGAPGRRLEEARIALVDDHRAGVTALEHVVDAPEAGQLPRANAGHVAEVRTGGRMTRRGVRVRIV